MATNAGVANVLARNAMISGPIMTAFQALPGRGSDTMVDLVNFLIAGYGDLAPAYENYSDAEIARLLIPLAISLDPDGALDM